MPEQMTTDQNQADIELLARRANQVQRGGARAAVLGVNDGLVSTLCILLGVAGAHGSHATILLAGLAGLIAGAISMAIGEWISVTSQVELFQGILKDLRGVVGNDRPLLIDQLSSSLIANGVSKVTAAKAAHEIAQDENSLFTSFASNVMEMNPHELGSPWTAAFSSFALFTLGSLVSLAPWFFRSDNVAVVLSIGFTALGGLLVGAYVGRSSGNNVLVSALRQFAIITLASVVTYGIGYIFGGVVA